MGLAYRLLFINTAVLWLFLLFKSLIHLLIFPPDCESIVSLWTLLARPSGENKELLKTHPLNIQQLRLSGKTQNKTALYVIYSLLFVVCYSLRWLFVRKPTLVLPKRGNYKEIFKNYDVLFLISKRKLLSKTFQGMLLLENIQIWTTSLHHTEQLIIFQ